MCYKFMVSFIVGVSSIMFYSHAFALPKITPENLIVNNPKIKYWNVKTSGSMRDGTTTREGKVVNVVRGTKIQDGSVCHNYGQNCYCTKAKFRITPSTESKWHVLVLGDKEETDCPPGISPTGHSEKTGLSREEGKSRREAIMKEKRERRAAEQ